MGEPVSGSELRHLLRIAQDAARVGADVVAAATRRPPAAETVKGLGDYVTSADRESEERIREFLSRATPDIGIVAEEGGGERGDAYWAVDPLDGTTNFVIGFPVVSVSVALVVDGRVLAGAVQAPLLDLSFSATRGHGAWKGPERLRVSARPTERAILAVALPFRDRSLVPRYLRMLEDVFPVTEDIRRAGSAALELAWTAAGVWDGYFELHLGVWDVAAGSLLVEEAGGVVTDWQGGSGYLQTGEVLAGSAQTHALLLEAARRTADGRG
jgi:myo-inositol-1(or 4)-monophosphatase